eukprot:10960852-Karenia_brevis.AAC.1
MRAEFVELQASQTACATDPISFVLGNLGWDTEASVIEARAYEVLQSIGVGRDAIQSLACRGNKGSLAYIILADGINWMK